MQRYQVAKLFAVDSLSSNTTIFWYCLSQKLLLLNQPLLLTIQCQCLLCYCCLYFFYRIFVSQPSHQFQVIYQVVFYTIFVCLIIHVHEVHSLYKIIHKKMSMQLLRLYQTSYLYILILWIDQE